MKDLKLKLYRYLIASLIIIPLANSWVFAEGDGYGVTNGGNNGTTVTVTNATALKTYAESGSAYRIIVSGTIDIGGSVKVGSNTTIEGANSSALIIGTLDCTDGNSNIIIKNLTITNPNGDGITIWTAYNVFVTHVTFYDCSDGCCDINHSSDFVTVSWCKFYYVNQTEHRYAMILGGDPYDAPGDKLHVTLHHNWFAEKCDQRQPSGSYSNAHVYNNYFSCTDNSYCTNARIGTNWLVENNYYDGVNNPCYYENGGKMQISGNIYSNCTGTISPSTSISGGPTYSYTLTSTSSVPSTVKEGAGNISSATSVTNAIINGTYGIIASHSGKALDTYAWGTGDGTNICQWTYWSGACQQFNISQVDGEWHRITPAISTGQAIDVYGASTENGANINTWTYGGIAGQQFRFQNAGSGVYRIINRNSDKCLDVTSASTDDGANVQQWNCTSGSAWQMFQLVKISDANQKSIDMNSSNFFSIYPNPSTDGKLFITAGSRIEGLIDVKIYDINGCIVYSESFDSKSSIHFDHNLKTGIYYVHIKNNNMIKNKKLIVL